MDQNSIRFAKMYYRKNMLVRGLSLEKNDISKILKNIIIKDPYSDAEEHSDDDISLSILKER